MATVDMTSGTVGRRANMQSAPFYLAERIVDFAAAATEKGSALAANDVIQVIDLPAGHYIYAAGIEVISAMTGTSTDSALDLGITGGDVDNFVDGFDFDGASVGDNATAATTDAGILQITSADTLDILIQAQTGTITGGKLRVWALLMDPSGRSYVGAATPGS